MRLFYFTAVALSGGLASAAPIDPAGLAARIDTHLADRWAAVKVTPAPVADDTTFCRRVHLDLIGRIPTVAEARAFLNDKAADKRAKLVAKLLDSAAHARHWATVWRREWIPQADLPQSPLPDEVDGWLAARLRDGMPYDRIARDLLTAPARGGRDATPASFLRASEYKPENLAANTTRAFLGINLDCAQCHNHPFARWSRDQFWQTAAFFVRLPDSKTDAKASRLEVTIPSVNKTVGPKLLDDTDPKWPDALTPETGRAVLAGWVTAKDNPYFARNAVNRLWAQLFGVGLVEPLDDLSGDNPPSHPELLDELAKAFADGGFDLKSLTAALVLTKAYQLSSESPGKQPAPRLFARAAVRGLTGEQLFDSLRVAAGLPPDRADLDPLNALRERTRFAEKFRVERTGEAQRSILQSLSLMNGPLTAELTDPAKAPTLRAVADAPFLDTAGKVEALFLAAVGRKPSADELAPLVKHVETGSDAGKALADVFWALLNGSEFNTNH